MKTYEIIEMGEEKFLKVTEESGKVWMSPMKETSRFYREYLRYTEWVEAGNNPEDFWTQDEALLTEGEEE